MVSKLCGLEVSKAAIFSSATFCNISLTEKHKWKSSRYLFIRCCVALQLKTVFEKFALVWIFGSSMEHELFGICFALSHALPRYPVPLREIA